MFGQLKKKIIYQMKSEILDIVADVFCPSDIKGMTILEAGSLDVNGSVRSVIQKWEPLFYIGIDIQEGNGVDKICNIYDLENEFGRDSFDVIFCTETLEHVENWLLATINLKRVLKQEGLLFVSAPRIGRKYHGYPYDYWRFEETDFQAIFADMDCLFSHSIKKIVMGKFQKPLNYVERDVSNLELFSVNFNKRIKYDGHRSTNTV